MCDLRMELYPKYRLGMMDYSGERRSWSLSDHIEICRLVRDLVSMGHPHLERGAKVGEQSIGKRVRVRAWRGKNLDLSEAVFAVRVGFDFASEGLSNFLATSIF